MPEITQSLGCNSRNGIDGTVGAGDSFIAGFLYSLLSGDDVLKCLRSGAKVASSVVQVFEPWVMEEE